MTKNEWAKNLIGSEYFTEVFDDLINIEMNKIISSRTDDFEERESSYTMIRAYNQILAEIESMATDSKIIEKRWKIF